MTRDELALALDDLQRCFQTNQISRDEFEGARMLLESQVETMDRKLQRIKPVFNGHKTAPYPSFRPEAVAQELGQSRDVPTPYQPPLTTSQHTLAVPPSNVPVHGPNHLRPAPTRHSPPPPSRAALGAHAPANLHDTPLSAGHPGSMDDHQPQDIPPTVAESHDRKLSELVEALKDLSQLHLQGVLSAQEYLATKTPILVQMRTIFRDVIQQQGSRDYPALLAKILAE